MHIAFFISEDWEAEFVRNSAIGDGNEFTFIKGPLTHDTLPEDRSVEGISVFIDSTVDRQMIELFPRLSFITTRSTGFDHIDLEAARERGITVMNVPTYGSNTVAEHAFALLLALSKRVPDGYEQVREGRGFNPHQLRGFDLLGRTLGVVGTGNIGRHAVMIGRGFGMEVLGFDPHPDEAFAHEQGMRYVGFEELLATSDVVTFHVPYMEATHHMLNCGNIETVKEGAVIINTSRGPIIETEALVEGLSQKRLRGVGLDVFEEEGIVKDELSFLAHHLNETEHMRTLLANHILIDHPDVIVTPHSAFNTEEALKRIMQTTVDNIASSIAGDPQNSVT